MSQNMLHIIGPTRMENASIVVGDREALLRLREAIDDALVSGSGAASTYASDGEPHAVAIIAEYDMYPVFTYYAHEACPARSRRETKPVDALANYASAMRKVNCSKATALALEAC